MAIFDFMNLPAWLQWVISTSLIVTALIGLIVGARRLWPVVTQFVETVNSLAGLPAFIDEQTAFRVETEKTLESQNETLDVIKHELFPNSGKSTRDRVDMTFAAVEQINLKLANDQARITDLEHTIPKTRKPRKPTE